MSNLLNRKKLLDRGPKIEPAEPFKMDDEPQNEATEVIENATIEEEAPKAPKAPKKRQASNITSVRVSKQTRNKLNALIQLGKADNVDVLIDILIDEYIEANLVKEDKKVFKLVLDIIQKRDK